jgi:3-hydroxyacyl-CoA dehydrogenase
VTRAPRSAAVLGAGVMGAQIAAHLANAGLPVILLDRTLEEATRGLASLGRLRPDPLFTAEARSLVRPGTFEDLSSLAEADWIVEAIVEQLDIKQALIARVESAVGPHAVVSSNTSAIPIADIARGRSPAFRRRWLGTHFFNPPRYMRLVEIIPTPDTDPDITAGLADFVDHGLGKGVVFARDAPGFIANRIGVFGALRLLEALDRGEFTVEEIDAITGTAIGRPKSATLRTLDIAGLDVVARVAADLARRLDAGGDAGAYAMPPLVGRMIERGLIGEKSGGGFYRRVKSDAGSTILALDPRTLDYRETVTPDLSALDAAASMPHLPARLRHLFLDPGRVGGLLRRTLGETLLYAARVAPEVADSPDAVDWAMRWGFGWELGPFETLDAIGLGAFNEACGVTDPPPLVRDALAAGRDRLRERGLSPLSPGLLVLRSAHDRAWVVRSNAGASLVDLGEGVLCVEFHSKMNTIGGDTLEMLREGVREAETNFTALVVGSESEVFSAGANLMLLLLEAQEGNWDEVDLMVRTFQEASLALRTSAVPVVAAPSGLALGGACEICLHADRVQAAAETYLGLVEVGVGLVPAGGGTKEMLVRAIDGASGRDPFPAIQAAFETIGFGRVSTSAAHARRLGYLRPVDGVTMNRERLIAAARHAALDRAVRGYRPVPLRAAIPVGGADHYATLSLGIHLAWRAGRISDHDALVGRKLAWILSGGNLPHGTTLSERELLDLEREAFLSLCGEPRTLERIGYTLRTGKSLRN